MVDKPDRSEKLARQLRYQARKSEQAASVPGIPPVKNPERREACRNNLSLFLRTYFPHSTGLKPFSKAHEEAIIRMQMALLEGGSVVLTCFPRGFGKTTISENTAIWAALYGHRKFVPIIGADKGASVDNIASLKFELTENDLLEEDFPEVVMPFKHLDNKSQRCATQKINGELSYVRWSADELGFAWVKDASGNFLPNSGALFRCLGITGRIRGMSVKMPNGAKQRPDFFILDDPQTDESAMSPAQCEKRMSIYQKSILRLGGHQKLLSGIINATVIEPEDMVDQLLSQEKHPEVEGMRIPMLSSMSDNHEKMWMDVYAEIRRTYNPEDPRDRRRAINEANEYYRQNQSVMDKGAAATWEHCYAAEDGEISAIHHAYNILIDDGPVVFASECQNEPISRLPAGLDFLSASEINTTRVGRHTLLPDSVETLSFHIDVQKKALYFTVVGFTDKFDMFPIRYGMFPEQPNGKLTYQRLRNTLAKKYRDMSDERQISEAVNELCCRLMAERFEREDGIRLKVDCGLVDGGYQTDAVHTGVKESKLDNVYVAFGRGIKAADTPMLQLARKPGERRSKDPYIPWRLLRDPNRRNTRYALFCANSVKTFLHRRIRTIQGESGSFLLPEGNHLEYAQHLSDSEFPTETEGPYGRVIEWAMKPGSPDNHLFDTTVGAIVAASISGKLVFGDPTARVSRPTTRKEKVQYLG